MVCAGRDGRAVRHDDHWRPWRIGKWLDPEDYAGVTADRGVLLLRVPGTTDAAAVPARARAVLSTPDTPVRVQTVARSLADLHRIQDEVCTTSPRRRRSTPW